MWQLSAGQEKRCANARPAHADSSPDTPHIRIWWEVDGVETGVYDNDVEQAIGGGNIVVHTSK